MLQCISNTDTTWEWEKQRYGPIPQRELSLQYETTMK